MNDSRLNYWIEAVECALEDINKFHLFSGDDIRALTENLQGSSEQEDMAFGIEHIPNPLETDIRNIKQQHEKEIESWKCRDLIFRKNVANRYGPRVSPKDVYIDGNDVMYDI